MRQQSGRDFERMKSGMPAQKDAMMLFETSQVAFPLDRESECSEFLARLLG